MENKLKTEVIEAHLDIWQWFSHFAYVAQQINRFSWLMRLFWEAHDRHTKKEHDEMSRHYWKYLSNDVNKSDCQNFYVPSYSLLEVRLLILHYSASQNERAMMNF